MKVFKIALILYLILICNAFRVIAQSSSGTIKLPVEVLGEEGVTISRDIILTDVEVGLAKRLWLQVNNLSYDNKASVMINDGDWYLLSNASVEMQYQEKARGGMVHGGFNTIRFSIPVSGLVAGINKIDFRFNFSDGISNGYRVVKFNLLDDNGAKLLSEELFEEDDPLDWEAPEGYSNSSSLQEGKRLWYGEAKSDGTKDTLWNNYLSVDSMGFWYGSEIKPFQKIKASCTDCHTQDGRDLEIFSYSNRSIIERAKFHNLSEDEGKKIAAYIRSLSSEDNVGRYGRPWNPPYQPGPDLEGKSVDEWAAGAGLDAVLEADRDMANYMFPDGINEQSVSDYFDSDKMYETYTLPLAIQFPDWKHWLPMIHPMDAYAKDDFYQRTYDDETPFENIHISLLNPQKGYNVYRELLEGYAVDGKIDLNNLSESQIQTLGQGHINFRAHFRFFQAQVIDSFNEDLGGHWRTESGDGLNAVVDGLSQTFAATSMARLMAVKNFEFMNEFGLQDQAPNYLNSEDKPSSRQWFMPDNDSKHVFEVPAHISGCQDNESCQNFQGQPENTGQFESSAWYQLQMVLTPGYGLNYGNGPVDFNYQPEFILNSNRSSGIYEPLRYYHTINNMYQVKTWSGGESPNDGRGFRMRVMGPWYFYAKEADDGLNQFAGITPGFFPTLLDEIEPGLKKWVITAQFRQFLKEVNKDFNSLDNWIRTDSVEVRPWGIHKVGHSSNALDPIHKTTVVDIQQNLPETLPDGISRDNRGDLSDLYTNLFADHFYYLIPKFAEMGVDCQVLDSVITWCEEAWPNINNPGTWDDLRGYSTVNLELSQDQMVSCSGTVQALATNVGNNPEYTWYVNNRSLSVNSDELDNVYFDIGDQVVCEVNSNSACAVGALTASDTINIHGITLEAKYKGEPIESHTTFDVTTGDSIELNLNLNINPVLWLDASNIRGADHSQPINGTSITSWSDLSGNANPVVSTTGLAPYYDEGGMNGLPAIMFGQDDVSDAIKLFDTSNDDFFEGNWTVFIVGKKQQQSIWSNILGSRDRFTDSGFELKFSPDGRNQLRGPSNSGNGNSSRDNTSFDFLSVIDKRDQVFSLSFNGYLDTELTEPVVSEFTNHKSIYLGQANNGNPSASYFKGAISEILVFDKVLTKEERQRIEGYLSHKWRMSNDLSTTHAFRFSSPLLIEADFSIGPSYVLDPIEGTQTIIVSAEESVTMDLNSQYCYSPLFTSDLIINPSEELLSTNELDLAPKGFSPNSDGIRDSWVLNDFEEGEVVDNSELRVFNRWGHTVYSAKPYKNDWKGTSSRGFLSSDELQLNEDTYFYTLKLNKSIRSGQIYIKR